MSGQRPQDLVFTLYGEYLLDHDEPVWVGSLIALLQPFDLSEGAVRTVLSRMVRKGWLETERRGRNSFYSLSRQGQRLLREGQEKIFHPSWDTQWDGTWLLLAYSIPEDVRQLRDRLRDRLAWLGFGSLGNGLWISPHRVEGKVGEIAQALDIEQHLECFRASLVASDDPVDLVRKCWDLDSVNHRYAEFVETWEPELVRCKEGVAEGSVSDQDCFTLRFDLIHEFRAFPLQDPFLPRSLLPDGWNGEDANRVFQALHDVLEGPADAYVEEVLSQAPETTGE